MNDFKNKKITVMGLGTHGGGVGAARFLAKAGAKVIVTDLKNAEELKESIEALKGLPIKFVLGQNRTEDFSRVDMVIKNPAVPNNAKSLQIARANKVPIETDVGIFFKLCLAPIIGVTGTRGKSTTTALVYEIIKSYNKNAALGGNIRISVLDILPKIKKDSIAILELSSWQLEGLAAHQKSPHISVVTNIMRDHLNRYSGMNEYIEAKKNIFRFQNKNDYLILNYDDVVVREFARESKAKVFFYGTGEIDENFLSNPQYSIGAWWQDGKFVFGRQKEEIMPAADLKLKGKHNVGNTLAAITVAKISNAPVKSIAKVVSEFTGLESRLQLIREFNRVGYINDTTSTTPDSTIAAVKSFSDKKINLILGGTDKNLDYKELASFLSDNVNIKNIIIFPGTATDKFKKELKNVDFHPNIMDIPNMNEAVKLASDNSEAGDIVLLSPGAASFGLFKNEFDRGAQFNAEVLALK